ncbi:MAG: zinc ribbon domain-containing protein [Chloroflexi bacterium]|nr:zinc ribbon domain-containing protein [Chloroflexota bacterium]
MPIYEYQCSVCGIHFEQFQRVDDDPASVCPNGHAGVRRIYSPAGIIFKGSGFYVTDHPKNNGRRGATPATSKAETTGKKEAGESKKTDTKKESPPVKESTSRQ